MKRMKQNSTAQTCHQNNILAKWTNLIMLSRVSVTIDGVSIGNWFTDHLQIVTTSNYKATDNLHALQITTAHTKPSQSAFTSRSLITDTNNVLCSRPYYPANVSQLTHCSNCPTLKELESKLLYDWLFNASQCVVAPNPLRLKTSIFFNWTLPVIILM
jgi:hypothetical protein